MLIILPVFPSVNSFSKNIFLCRSYKEKRTASSAVELNYIILKRKKSTEKSAPTCTVNSSLLLFQTVRRLQLYCQFKLALVPDSTPTSIVLSSQACSRSRQYAGFNCTVFSSSLLLPTVRQHQLYCLFKLALAPDSTPASIVLSFQACSCSRQYAGINCTVDSSRLTDPTVRRASLYCLFLLAKKSNSIAEYDSLLTHFKI